MFHWAKQIIASLLSKLIVNIALNLTFRKAESALESLSPEVYKNMLFLHQTGVICCNCFLFFFFTREKCRAEPPSSFSAISCNVLCRQALVLHYIRGI